MNKNLSSNAEHNILEFIKNNAKIKRNITISWFGGEPLLKFADIKRMLHKACQYGDEYGCKITSDITTNGYLLNEQNIREMKQLNVKSIQITIDGDRESHNKRRYLAGAGETYDKIKENLIKVSEQNIFVILRINIDEKKCRHRNKYIK
ncbi:radical SAM protein [Roseburia inulinivorans]|uniref:radical SAM protein n=1 Tax=Roseburia inulinivorans TaxID=360807 RepID=UPI001C26210C|nr:radical SAM protein [Roseburia inulinivorans]